jgi:ADP-ribosylglycohydrolase
MTTQKERIYGCLLGVAAGDAMGMPTSLMSPGSIRKTFVDYVEDFLPAPKGHVIHDKMVAGQVTDDTQLTLLLADALIERGHIDPQDVARRLLKWAEDMGAFDNMLVGPSSLRALHLIRAGVPIEKSGITGDTNGASMRIAPVGIYGQGDLEKTVDAVAAACMPTHYTNIAIAGASAVAMIIGRGIQGENDLDELVGLAMQAVDLGMTRGTTWFGASIKSRTALAIEIASRSKDKLVVMRDLYETIGAGVATTETVPVCLGMLKFANGQPVEAIRMATNLGGDCDTTASIVGGMCGAIAGVGAFPNEWIDKLEEVNDLHLEEYADKLAETVAKGRGGNG